MGRARTCIELQKPRKFSVIECTIGTEHGHWPPTNFCLGILVLFLVYWMFDMGALILFSNYRKIGKEMLAWQHTAKQSYRDTFTMKMTPFKKLGIWWRRWHGFASVTGQTRAVEDDECGLGGGGGGMPVVSAVPMWHHVPDTAAAPHRLGLELRHVTTAPHQRSRWGTSLLSIFNTYDVGLCCYSICWPLPWCP